MEIEIQTNNTYYYIKPILYLFYLIKKNLNLSVIGNTSDIHALITREAGNPIPLLDSDKKMATLWAFCSKFYYQRLLS